MEEYKQSLQRELDVKTKEYESRKQYIIRMVNNEFDTVCFERNAISELIVLNELKSEIKQLKKQIEILYFVQ